jgi:hypothetical protein
MDVQSAGKIIALPTMAIKETIREYQAFQRSHDWEKSQDDLDSDRSSKNRYLSLLHSRQRNFSVVLENRLEILIQFLKQELERIIGFD